MGLENSVLAAIIKLIANCPLNSQMLSLKPEDKVLVDGHLYSFAIVNARAS